MQNAPRTVSLNVLERMAFRAIMPQKGKFSEVAIAEMLTNRLELTEDEFEQVKLDSENEAEVMAIRRQQIVDNKKAKNYERPYSFSSKILAFVVTLLSDLAKAGNLPRNCATVYAKFIPEDVENLEEPALSVVK